MKNNLFIILILFVFPFSVYAKESYNTVEDETEETPIEKTMDGFLFSKFSLNEPVFFALGTPNTKVQFSFKYRLLKKAPLYFAMKEEIFWDLFEESAPFSNVQYSPEVFYRLHFEDSSIRNIDFGIFKHHSNGKGGVDSRSVNQSYLRIVNKVKSESFLFRWGGEVHAYYSLGVHNQDLYKYQGYYTIEFSFAQLLTDIFYDSEVILLFKSAGNNGLHPLLGNKTFIYQFRPFSSFFSPSFYIQASYGYSESFLYYNKTEFSARAGISLME